MKTFIILCLVFQLSAICAQTTDSDFKIQKGLIICPVVQAEPDLQIIVSVYDGEVAAVVFNPGFKTAVIIKHGSFYTVYSGFEKTDLEKGALVVRKQEIGRFADDNGKFHFEIWKGLDKLETKNWVSCLN